MKRLPHKKTTNKQTTTTTTKQNKQKTKPNQPTKNNNNKTTTTTNQQKQTSRKINPKVNQPKCKGNKPIHICVCLVVEGLLPLHCQLVPSAVVPSLLPQDFTHNFYLLRSQQSPTRPEGDEKQIKTLCFNAVYIAAISILPSSPPKTNSLFSTGTSYKVNNVGQLFCDSTVDRGHLLVNSKVDLMGHCGRICCL